MEVQYSPGVGQVKAVDMLCPLPARRSLYSVLLGAEFVIQGIDCGSAQKGKERSEASCFTWMEVAWGGFSGEAHSRDHLLIIPKAGH